ncbi:hypothetical protein [Vagococcus xieshaowenii]|uniref:Uncharacterized protein n=1 Tax=Vagococcus xieshaowenii TaxID=2562451 RepID=A0AAJ5JLX7_9ENTE|nr:hypothetical protein [Vagococcus xieshaowenii]QCA28239.1 hypothetical protein E4Z98_02500 [Vagococcus xieshaowenii]TFZ41894.1 hypothetical protein E4031_04680 [Vagococcus xieshaowenii]
MEKGWYKRGRHIRYVYGVNSSNLIVFQAKTEFEKESKKLKAAPIDFYWFKEAEYLGSGVKAIG